MNVLILVFNDSFHFNTMLRITYIRNDMILSTLNISFHVRIPHWLGEENETPFIRVWKPEREGRKKIIFASGEPEPLHFMALLLVFPC